MSEHSKTFHQRNVAFFRVTQSKHGDQTKQRTLIETRKSRKNSNESYQENEDSGKQKKNTKANLKYWIKRKNH